MAHDALTPASSNSGFIQQQPVLENQFMNDTSLRRILKLFLPDTVLRRAGPDLSQLGDEVLTDEIFKYVTDSEKNLPYLRGNGRDSFGRLTNDLIVTEGWRKLQDFGIEKGVVASNYDGTHGQYSRLVQFLRCYLWVGSCANTLCPAAMQDGAARILQLQLRRDDLQPIQRTVFQNAYDRLVSRDPRRAWTSGQWMTERSGGSDVSQSETVATYEPLPHGHPISLADVDDNIPLGPWVINGFKWFSSATDSSMTILLAKTGTGKGLSAFYAPMRRYNPTLVAANGKKGGYELNGVNIQRLKNKLGTQSLPTAELELKGMRGWLIGEEGKGIQEISTILTITRVHTTSSSVGKLSRGISIAKSFALVREVGAGKGARMSLYKHPLHVRTLAGLTGELHALNLLTFYTIYVMGLDEATALQPDTVRVPTPPKRLVAPLLRILSSVHKGYCCEQSIPLLYACMAALGGVGYQVNSDSEHINVARLFRDNCVTAIWEGTTDVLSSDTLRALKHPAAGAQSIEALDWLVGTALSQATAVAPVKAIESEWRLVKELLERETQATLLADGRKLLYRIAEVVIAVLFIVDAAAEPGPEIELMAQRFFVKRGFQSEDGLGVAPEEYRARDLAIVYGRERADDLATGVSKL